MNWACNSIRPPSAKDEVGPGGGTGEGIGGRGGIEAGVGVRGRGGIGIGVGVEGRGGKFGGAARVTGGSSTTADSMATMAIVMTRWSFDLGFLVIISQTSTCFHKLTGALSACQPIRVYSPGRQMVG